MAVAATLGATQVIFRDETLAALDQWVVAETLEENLRELHTAASQW